MKSLLVVVLLFSLLAFANPKFQCPMHCEGTKTYDKAGSCPICHMDLAEEVEEKNAPLNSRDFRVDLETSPKELLEGKKVEFKTSIMSTKLDKPVKDLAEGTEIYLIKKDGTFFERFLPRAEQSDFRFETVLGSQGYYLLYVAFKPQNGERQVIPLTVKIKPGEKKHLAQNAFADWHIQLRKTEKIQHGTKTSVSFNVEKKNKNTKQILRENFRWYAMSEDTTKFLMGEGQVKDEKLGKASAAIDVKFPKPGKYTLFLELWNEKKAIPFSLTAD